MGKLKPVEVNWYFAWISDDAINIVFAHMVEVGRDLGVVSDELLRSWEAHAFIGNSIMFTYRESDDIAPETMALVVDRARQRIVAMGDVTPDQISEWTISGDRKVADGSLRGNASMKVERLLEVVDWLAQALAWDSEWEYGANVGSA